MDFRSISPKLIDHCFIRTFGWLSAVRVTLTSFFRWIQYPSNFMVARKAYCKAHVENNLKSTGYARVSAISKEGR